MINMVPIGWALALAQPNEPHVLETWKVEKTEPISGADFLLMSEAFKHPEIRDRDLSCYHVQVITEKGVRTVVFSGDREPVREVVEGNERIITYPGPNSRCPSRSFEMDNEGKVVRVIYERH